MTRATHSPTATLFLATSDVLAVIRRKGLVPLMREVAQRIRQDFLAWESFDKSARVGCHSEHGVIELMPVADAQQFGFKYVNGHPGNTRAGLPTVMAFGLLADVRTGVPVFLSELTLVTAVRTAAMSAVAAKALARPGSRCMAVIGNGAQSEFQALAFRSLLGIEELRLFDTDAAATAKLVANLAGSGLTLTLCTSTAQAVQGADIVTTITADKALAQVITPDMVRPGMHFNAVGGDCPGKTELHRGVLQAARVFVEYEPQSRIEGDVQQMPADFPVTELWRVLAGQQPGRLQPDDVTVFDSVGFALEDLAALKVLHAAALEYGLGQMIDLVAAAPDPKNLFGLLAEAQTPEAPTLEKEMAWA